MSRPAIVAVAVHALGSRVLGLTQQLFETAPAADPAAGLHLMAATYPHIAEIALRADHDGGSTVGPGCDDQFESEFALDVLLDGFERLRVQGWRSAGGPQ
jgi:hypothetical protein